MTRGLPETARGLPEAGLTVMRAAVGGLFIRKWDVHVRGESHVPEDGPVIVASNHLGWADGPLMVVKTPRNLHVLTKEEEFAGQHRHLLRTIGQIKLARNRVDSGALRTAERALAAGQAVGIFPEGLRGDGEFRAIKSGVAWLALISGAPVVPLAIFGTREPGDGPSARPADGARIDMVFGNPIQFDAQPWPRDKPMLTEATEQIHAHLTEHLAWSRSAVKRELPGPMPAGARDV